MEEISDPEANLEKLIKIIESLDNDFVSCVKKAGFEKDMTQVSNLISKANTWSDEVKSQIKMPRNLMKHLSYLKPERKNLNNFTKCFDFDDLLALVLIYVTF